MTKRVVSSVSLNIWRFMWYDSSTKNGNSNTLNYMGGWGSQIPTLVSSQDNFILPNGMKTSDVPLFIPNPVSNIPISPSTISLPNYFTVKIVPDTTIISGTREIFIPDLIFSNHG